MARPPSGVPLSPWHRVSDQIGRDIAAGRTAPNPNLISQSDAHLKAKIAAIHAGTDPATFTEAGKMMGQHISAIHDHAKLSTGGEGPYPVKGFANGLGEKPHDVDIRRTTAGSEMKDLVYGDQYENMVDAIDQAPQPTGPGALNRDAFGGLRAALTAPLHIVTRRQFDNAPPVESPAYAQAGRGLVYLDENGRSLHRHSPEAVLGHELRHAYSHHHKDARDYKLLHGPKIPTEYQKDSLGKIFYPDPTADNYVENIVEMDSRLRHGQKLEELEAMLGELKGLSYGMTGKLVKDPADNIRLLGEILNSNHKDPLHAADPTMNYGPRAGQPAERKSLLEATIKTLWNRGSAGEKQRTIENMQKIMSTAKPNEAPNV